MPQERLQRARTGTKSYDTAKRGEPAPGNTTIRAGSATSTHLLAAKTSRPIRERSRTDLLRRHHRWGPGRWRRRQSKSYGRSDRVETGWLAGGDERRGVEAGWGCGKWKREAGGGWWRRETELNPTIGFTHKDAVSQPDSGWRHTTLNVQVYY
jgi:hypothetical protein